MFPVIKKYKDNQKVDLCEDDSEVKDMKKHNSNNELIKKQKDSNENDNDNKSVDGNNSSQKKQKDPKYPNFIQNYIQWIMEEKDQSILDAQELNSNDKKKEFKKKLQKSLGHVFHLNNKQQSPDNNQDKQVLTNKNKIEKIRSENHPNQLQDTLLIQKSNSQGKSKNCEIKVQKLDIMGRQKDKIDSPLCYTDQQNQQALSQESNGIEKPYEISVNAPEKTQSFPNFNDQKIISEQKDKYLQVSQQQPENNEEDEDDEELGDLDMQKLSYSISGIHELSPKRHPSMQVKNLDILLRSDRVKQLREYITKNSEDQLNCYDKIHIVMSKGVKEGQLQIQQEEHKYATQLLCEAIKIRDQKYMNFKNHYHCISDKFIKYCEKGTPYLDWSVKVELLPKIKGAEINNESGVIFVNFKDKNLNYIDQIQKKGQYIKDFLYIQFIVNDKKVKSLCYERIKLQEKQFEMHELLNYDKELKEQKEIMYQDFFTIPKVDTHIHHSACMSAKQLADFLIEILSDPEQLKRIVKTENGQKFTLKDVLNQIGVDDPREINVDSLNVQADRTLFKRFDNFNNKYNPQSSSLLREIFLKTDNDMGGEYLALITKRQMEVLAKQNSYVEWRLSIYGKNQDEWSKLGKWIFQNGLNTCIGSEKVSWMIQIPRLYHIYKKRKIIENFKDMIDNIFKPLFEVTLHPESDPELYRFLIMIGGFDSVDDESIFEQLQKRELSIDPQNYTETHNPHYIYWMYYMYANILSLNYLRKIRGLNTFSYRPHCGESGDQSHLISAFLLTDAINHGITLQQHVSLKYLYYLEQIGLAMSPLSNNKLFLKYRDSPFKKLFQAGFNVSLSTDDPLILHLTSEPLVEEYAIASQIWNLSSVDICEIARNSVVQSSLPEPMKQFWAGQYRSFNSKANNYQHSNLPQSRFLYRLETKAVEFQFLGKFLEESEDSSDEIQAQ